MDQAKTYLCVYFIFCMYVYMYYLLGTCEVVFGFDALNKANGVGTNYTE